MNKLAREVNRLEEIARESEQIYKSELISELGLYIDDMFIKGTCVHGDQPVKDTFFELVTSDASIGTLFPFRRAAFIYSIGDFLDKNNRDIVKEIFERRGYTVSVNKSYIPPEEHVKEFHRYSGNE